MGRSLSGRANESKIINYVLDVSYLPVPRALLEYLQIFASEPTSPAGVKSEKAARWRKRERERKNFVLSPSSFNLFPVSPWANSRT